MFELSLKLSDIFLKSKVCVETLKLKSQESASFINKLRIGEEKMFSGLYITRI